MTRASLIVVLLWSSTVRADPAGAQAEVLFRQGLELRKNGNIKEACTAFDASQKLEPTVRTQVNLADCREKLGDLATAWGLFLDVMRQTRSPRDAASRQIHKTAQEQSQKLEPRVSKLTVNVSLKSHFDGLEILRGTERIEPALWNRALPVDGGTYTITARAPGSNPWSTQVTVAAESDSKTVEIPNLRNLPRDVAPPPVAAAPVAAPPVPATPAEAETERGSAPRRSKVVPFAIGAGAVALLGAGVGFELSARSRYSAYKAETTNLARRDSLFHTANTRRYVAEACAVTGLAAGGAALWFYLRDRAREQPPASATLYVIPTGTGLALSGQF